MGRLLILAAEETWGDESHGLGEWGARMMHPRLGLATSALGPEPSVMSLALLAGLTRRGLRVQHFRTRACPLATEVVGQVTGLPGRHLDAWLMPAPFCRSVFARVVADCDLAVVEGTLEPPRPCTRTISCDRPGPLAEIANCLDLPLLAVLNCQGWGQDSLHLPRLPEGVQAVLLDGVANPEQVQSLRRLVRMATGLPVIAALGALSEVRSVLGGLGPDHPLPDGLVDHLARSFLEHADLAALDALARSRPFPDTLDALEDLGARIIEFSPLHDETLPENVDLVLLGCGRADQEIAALSSNLSMIASLRVHVCRGRRMYAEGGGAAYLGRFLTVGGKTYPGAGILPFHAELVQDPQPPIPVVRTLTHDCWLGRKGTEVRGYLSQRWRLRQTTEGLDCPACYGALSQQGDWFYHHHALGSLMHLYLPALPEVVNAFARPHSASLRRPLPSRSIECGSPDPDIP
jgi:cobyrinic acid a,c-diamide synthase